jgi:hypothetical protein
MLALLHIATLANGETEHDPLSAFVAMLAVLGIVLVAILLTISVRGRIAQRQADKLTPRERIEQIKERAGMGGDGARGAGAGRASAISAQYLDSVQRLAAQLDNKAERLVQLIVEADERIAALEQVERRPQARHPAAAAPEQPAMPSPPVDSLTRSIYDMSDAGSTPVEIAQRLDEQVGKVELILALRER